MNSQELPSNGLERYTSERVVFRRPFSLGKSPDVYPAGTYEVETKKLPATAAGHTAWIRASTVLVVPTSTGSLCREISGKELDEALLNDSRQSLASEPSENPDKGGTGMDGAAL